MFQSYLTSVLIIWALFFSVAVAHPVPTLVVEAEFTPQRTATFRVNLDPRLFLAPQPSSLPPVPAFWWLDQDESEKAKSLSTAISYIDRILLFKVGETLIKGTWLITPIDSSSFLPLEASSAEIHLLAVYTGPLPTSDDKFTLTVSKECPVGLILVNSIEGLNERKPQSLFGGETSVEFALPAKIHPAEVKSSSYMWLAILMLPLLILAMRFRKR